MHFHLLKPVHGWRAFAGEVAVIVLGVLIALFAQQLAQSFDNRSSAQAARDNIRAELAVNIGRMQNADLRAACDVTQFVDTLRRREEALCQAG